MVKSSTCDDEDALSRRPGSGDSQRSARSDNSNEERDRSSSSGNKPEFSRYIVLDYAENGDLFDFVVSINEAMGEDMSRYYFS